MNPEALFILTMVVAFGSIGFSVFYYYLWITSGATQGHRYYWRHVAFSLIAILNIFTAISAHSRISATNDGVGVMAPSSQPQRPQGEGRTPESFGADNRTLSALKTESSS